MKKLLFTMILLFSFSIYAAHPSIYSQMKSSPAVIEECTKLIIKYNTILNDLAVLIEKYDNLITNGSDDALWNRKRDLAIEKQKLFTVQLDKEVSYCHE